MNEQPFFPASAHGGDGAALAAQLGIPVAAVTDLSASLNPFAPDVAALVAAHASAVRRYPDERDAHRALATAIGVAPERLLLTNGGAEAIALVAAIHPRGRVDDPDFSLYRDHLTALAPDAPRWRSNPHNPTGRLAPAGETAAVWDEAFYALATGTWTRGDPGAIAVGSLTKLFACPGLRAGYVITPDEDQAAALRARRPAWSLNGIASAVLPELIARAELRLWTKLIAAARDELGQLLRTHGLEPEPSDANYVLVRNARGVRDHLARHAVLVRDTASFGLPDGVRIAVPDERGLEHLARGLAGYARS
jgi:histidinol-phosphate/aromatic aminotransferase/cobyric acid decarboxylase-like protein